LKALKKNKLDCARELIATGKATNHRDFQKQTSALHLCAQKGFLHEVQLLISKGKTDVNARNIEQRTPLHEAVVRGYPSICFALLQAGADPKLVDKKNRTPIEEATQCGRQDLAIELERWLVWNIFPFLSFFAFFFVRIFFLLKHLIDINFVYL
jgi:ankyrin repeat protein